MNGETHQRDAERLGRIAGALEESRMEALVCALPSNVLLLTGYWPVVGTSLAVATAGGSVQVLVPEDEEELARRGWADEVHAFTAGSLEEMKSAAEAARGPLGKMVRKMGVGRGGVVGFEGGPCFEPSSYAAVHRYGGDLRRLLTDVLPSSVLRPADELLARLRSVPTGGECEHVRAACRIAAQAYGAGARRLRLWLKEVEVAALFRAPLSAGGRGVARADGFAYCMSGPNSAEAYAAYQLSRGRVIYWGDLVLVHCNSYADGYWTDITRTFCVGEIDERKRGMYEAVFAARDAALGCIRPGVKAMEVDRAARAVLESRGYGAEFKHGLGHGVGFAAINHNARPRLHPASADVLEAGMIFNVEPAIYVEGYGGLRHCDMVVVRDDGAEVLTPFLSDVEELRVA